MPERAHEIGILLYRGLDSVQFAYLTDAIPELIPRGATGYVKKQ
jgi:hypothetical protein